MSTGLAKLVSSVAHRHKFSLVECSLEKSSTNNGFISVNKLLLYYTNQVNVLDRHGSFNVRLLNDYFLSVNVHHTDANDCIFIEPLYSHNMTYHIYLVFETPTKC